MTEPRVSELMTSAVTSIRPDASLLEVASLMRDKQISCLIVLHEGKPVGIISERDLVRVLAAILEGKTAEHSVAEDLMSSPVVTVLKNSSLPMANFKVNARPIRRLPVVDGEGMVVGIVTESDLLAKQWQIKIDAYRSEQSGRV